MLAAGMGKKGISKVAFWDRARADCPTLAPRTSVCCRRLPCIIVTAGVQCTAGCRCMVAINYVCGGHSSSMRVWHLRSDCAYLADGNTSSCAMQQACIQRSIDLRGAEKAADKADTLWTEEEDAALNAGKAGGTSWSALLRRDKRLRARGKASLIPCWLA